MINKHSKKCIFLFIFLYLVFLFCCMQTYLISDDLHYSFYLHDIDQGRITNFFQVIQNQIWDYSHYNCRFVIHIIVQTLLIFGKGLWNVLNPIMILITIYYFAKILSLLTHKKEYFFLYCIFGLFTFLSLYEYKYLVYWVAGSVNYIWAFAALITYLYYWLCGSLENKFWLQCICILFFSSLCEYMMVIFCVFVFGNLILEYIKYKKIQKKHFLYLLFLAGGILLVFLSPGEHHRIMENNSWYSLTVIEQLSRSIPVVSYHLLSLDRIQSIIPVFYIVSILVGLFKIKQKDILLLTSCTILLCFIFHDGWYYFFLAILSFIGSILYCKQRNQYSLILLSIMFYANAFFMVFVPEYFRYRPNYLSHWFMGLYFFFVFCYEFKLNKIISLSFCAITFLLLCNDIVIYYKIGVVSKENRNSIMKVAKNKEKVLKIRKVDFDCDIYHIDCNYLGDNNYWANSWYKAYYGLDHDTMIVEK